MSPHLCPGTVSSLMSLPCPCQLGLSICYDLRFPEISLALRHAGAEILTYPSAFTVPTGSAHWEVSSALALPASPLAPCPAPGGSCCLSLVLCGAGDNTGAGSLGLSPHPNHLQQQAHRDESYSQEGQI